MGGVAWARRTRPPRMRATYHRRLLRKRKRLPELFEAFQRLRRRYAGKKLFVIMDNLHHLRDNPRFLALLRRLRIHPVWTPTEASWLNLIEAHFGCSSASPWSTPIHAGLTVGTHLLVRRRVAPEKAVGWRARLIPRREDRRPAVGRGTIAVLGSTLAQ